MADEPNQSFFNNVRSFDLSYNEILYLNDIFSIVREDDSLIPLIRGLNYINFDSSKTFKPNGVAATDDVIIKILFALSRFETSIVSDEIEIDFTIKELLMIRECAITTRMYNKEAVGKQLLSKIAKEIGNSFSFVPQLEKSIVNDIEEIIENFEKRKEG